MKRLFFILFFIPFVSYCQTDNEFMFQRTFSNQWGYDCISEIDCFYSTYIFNDDDNYYTLYYSYGNESWQAIDSIDPSGFYSSSLFGFKNEIENSYIVLWKNESEYSPFFNVYYILEGKIVKIGEWEISVLAIEYHCEYCDYSMEDIRIYQRNNEIEFSFLKNMVFGDFSENKYNDDWNWTSYQAGELILSFNIVDGTVKKVIERE
jgi:hypothetical protein